MTASVLQDRILDILRDEGPIAVTELPRWLKGHDTIACDVAISALLRANRISRSFGKYEIARGAQAAPTRVPAAIERPRQSAPAAGKPSSSSPPPNATEEVRSSLDPNSPRTCADCQLPFPLKSYPRNRYGPMKYCAGCFSKRCRQAKPETPPPSGSAPPVITRPPIMITVDASGATAEIAPGLPALLTANAGALEVSIAAEFKSGVARTPAMQARSVLDHARDKRIAAEQAIAAAEQQILLKRSELQRLDQFIQLCEEFGTGEVLA